MVFNEFKEIKVGVLWRHLASITVVLGSLWLFAGPFVQSYAQDALRDMLTEQGLSPKVFADVQRKVDEIDRQTNGVQTDIEKMKQDIGVVLQNQSNIKNNAEETKKQVDRIVDFLIGRRVP